MAPDFATVIGLFGAMGIVAVAIAGGQGGIPLFINVPSLLIVIVGSVFVALMKFGLGDFLGAVKVAIKAFFFRADDIAGLIQTSVNLAEKARQNGIVSLEEEKVDSPFLQKGIAFIVDNMDPAVTRSTLSKEMLQTVERHDTGQQIFKAIGDAGPAMGMIGTLIGLVQMLAAMDDPKTIGPAMAVALLTTLYGAVLGNMVALPIADKLALRSQQERRARLLMIDAITAIQSETHPRTLEEILMPYLPGSKRPQTANDD